MEKSGEDALIEARRGKAEHLRSRGQNPFANDAAGASRSLLRDIREQFAPALIEPVADLRYDPAKVEAIASGREYYVLGRLVSRRGFGKASFLRLRDMSDELQLFAKQDVLGDSFAALEDIDIADHLEARGQAMVTKTGELSLQITSLRLLTKALRPLPDKFHGLTDVDLRYRRRYVDLVANPEVSVALRARSIIVQGLRDFLDSQGFLEVETPTLHPLVGGAAAKPFKTHHNTLDLELFLRIAPELYLKRLLVGGLERVYEIGRCYRNEGISTRHNPEFTMLEFYQAYATYETLMDQAERLFRHVDAFLERRLTDLGLDAHYRRWLAERPFALDEPFARVPMKLAVSSALARAELPAEIASQLAELAFVLGPDGKRLPSSLDAAVEGWKQRSERAKSIDWGNLRRALTHCKSDGERLFVAYEYLAEPFLAVDYRAAGSDKSLPVFITDYPAEVSPLARKKDADPTLVDRFELFVHGRELCNAFSELNDPDDQAARFRAQLELKAGGAEETMDYDEDYVLALEHGMPPAAGFGLGVDRLAMALTAQPSIRDVIAFPLLRPESA
ncbi:MAG TPA: lysine--tRNA ligase [Polyangiaceae bacterium]|nr:lysine--tRNA ligase [Polyangiaceae bacterium]